MRTCCGPAIVLLATAVFALGGCARDVRLDNPLDIPTANPERVAKVTERVLQELRFQLIYPKVVPERIETAPLTGASWWEFWREDTVGGYQTAESSFHTIRRHVSVALKPREDGTQLAVRVTKERLAQPGTGPLSIGESFGVHMYETMPMLLPNFGEPAHQRWVDRGRDDACEQRILNRIYRYLALGTLAK